MFKVWIKKEIITNNELLAMNQLMSNFTCPAGVGRIPSKISSNYGNFTAAQWKTWITVYSPVVLKSVLSHDLYCHWLIFVRACFLIGQRVLKRNDIDDY